MAFDRLAYKQAILDLINLRIRTITDPNYPNGVVVEDVAETLSQALEQYVAAGFKSVRVATTAAISLTAPGTLIDGVTLSSVTVQPNGDIGDRVLVKNQVDQTTNGVYLFKGAAVPMVRASDANESAEFITGQSWFVIDGTDNGMTAWVLATPGTITLGTSNLVFVELSASTSITLTGDVTGSGTSPIATTIAVNAVTDSKFRQSAGVSVVGKYNAGTGNVADIVSTSDNQFLVRRSGDLTWGTIQASDVAFLSGTYVPLSRNITINGTTQNLSADRTWNVGTVTSIGVALPASVFSVAGSPVTGAGTITGSFINQTANTVFAGPVSGGSAVPAFRALVAADLPSGSGLYIQNQFSVNQVADFSIQGRAKVVTLQTGNYYFELASAANAASHKFRVDNVVAGLFVEQTNHPGIVFNGTADYFGEITVNSTSNSFSIYSYDGTRWGMLYRVDSGRGYYWDQNTTEGMRLNANNRLLIGGQTDQGAYRLQVFGSSLVQTLSSSTGLYVLGVLNGGNPGYDNNTANTQILNDKFYVYSGGLTFPGTYNMRIGDETKGALNVRVRFETSLDNVSGASLLQLYNWNQGGFTQDGYYIRCNGNVNDRFWVHATGTSYFSNLMGIGTTTPSTYLAGVFGVTIASNSGCGISFADTISGKYYLQYITSANLTHYTSDAGNVHRFFQNGRVSFGTLTDLGFTLNVYNSGTVSALFKDSGFGASHIQIGNSNGYDMRIGVEGGGVVSLKSAVGWAFTNFLYGHSSGNIAVGTTVPSVWSGTNSIQVKNGTAPSSSFTDGFYIYSSDVAGSAVPSFRTEAGTVVKLYPEAVVTKAQEIADRLTSQGLLTAGSVILNNDIVLRTIADVNDSPTSADYVLEYTSLTDDRIVTLFDPSTYTNRVLIVKDGSGQAGTYGIFIDDGGYGIDGASMKSINTNYGRIALYSNGSTWRVLYS